MRRKPSSASPSGAVPRAARGVRLIRRIPLIYVGPDALPALRKGRGILLGAQRPGWVDAVWFEPFRRASWKELVERRFDEVQELEPVGIVLSLPDLRRHEKALCRALVPGDVVLGLPEQAGQPRGYVNRGDTLAPAVLKLSGTRH